MFHDTTVGASSYPDLFPGCDGSVPGGNGVWYFVLGFGTKQTVTLECNAGSHELLVLCPQCSHPQDDPNDRLCLAAPAQCGESTTWCTYDGANLLIRSLGEPGDFSILVEDSNEECEIERSCYDRSNDECANAQTLTVGQSLHGDTFAANSDEVSSCGPGGGGSYWYKVTGDGSRLTAKICSVPKNPAVHTLGVMCNSCDVPRCLPGGFMDSTCEEDNEISWCSKFGETYYLRVDGPLLASAGEFQLSIVSEGGFCNSTYECVPANDSCESASDLPLNQKLDVSMSGATPDQNEFCILNDERPGIWFDVIGDGTVLEASICSVNAYEPFVRVHCGSCDSPACIDADYTPRDENPVPNEVCEDGVVSLWKWCSREGETYHLHVADWADDPSSWFEFTVKSTVACADSQDCIYDPPPANDDCDDAIPIAGEGFFDFENTHATPEEPYDMCHYTGAYPPTHDVWYCWTSPCDGPVTVETCGLTTVDTQLAVYPGCDCDEEFELECNNDSCGYQSHVKFMAIAGQTYRIQVGTRIELGGGSGQFRIVCGEEPPLQSPCEAQNMGRCVNRSNENAVNSTRGQFVMADNFTAKESQFVLATCWWGANFDGVQSCSRDVADNFQITYYGDFCGKPWGIVGGPFSQSHGTLEMHFASPGRSGRLIGGVAPEIEYSAYHESVVLEEGQTYWVEITNSSSGNCSWFWETSLSSDPFSFQSPGAETTGPGAVSIPADAAFEICQCGWDCIESTYAPICHPAPTNDACFDSQYLNRGEVAAFKSTGAETDGLPIVPVIFDDGTLINYFPLGDRQVHKDIWFDIETSCPGTIAVDVCNADFDVKSALYIGPGCEIETPIAVDDDSCGEGLGLQSRLTTFLDGTYYLHKLRIGGYRGDFGSGQISWDYAPPEFSDLRTFAAFANCQWTSCLLVNCGPPLSSTCCFPQDFDADGDVDLLDYLTIHDTLVGP